MAALQAHPEVHVLPRTTAFGRYDDGFVLALERRTDHLAAARPDARGSGSGASGPQQIVIATGAHERPIVFDDNDRPGIMLAGAARTYLNRYGVLVGARAVVFTTNDSAYLAAIELADAGVEIAALVDARAKVSSRWAARLTHRGIAVHCGHVVTGTAGERAGRAASLVATGGRRARAGRRALDCDTAARVRRLESGRAPATATRAAGCAGSTRSVRSSPTASFPASGSPARPPASPR